MNKLKILVLAYKVKEVPVDSGNIFIQTLIENDALYLNYKDLYNKYGFYGTENYITKYVKDNAINSIIFGTGGTEFYFDLYFFEELRKKFFLVMQTGDTEHYYEVHTQYYAQAMDLVIVGDFISPFKLREIGTNSIPFFAYCNTMRYRKLTLEKNIDVSFIGQISNKVGRQNYINYLLENGIKVEIYGHDSQNGLVSVEKKVEITNRSKINLTFSGLTETTKLTRKYQIHKRKRQLKGRTEESIICGGFVLSEYAPGLENLFEIGKEIDIFHDKEELLEKIKYYLEHEEERENIAQKGYERAIRDYNVGLAVPKLVSTINELRKKKIYKPSEIYLDEEFIRNYTTYRVLLMIRFIKAGKWKLAFEELKIILKYRKLDWYQISVFFNEEILSSFPKIKLMLKLLFRRNKK